MSRYLSNFISRILPILVIIHALVFILFWITNRLFYASTNDFLADMVGQRLDFVSLLLWVSAFIAAWSIIRLVLASLKKSHRLAKLTAWLYCLVSLVYIGFFYGSFNMLFNESPVQLVRVGQLLGYFRFYLDAVVVLGLGLSGALLLRNYLLKRPPGTARHTWWLLAILLVVFAVLWVVPFAMPPGAVIRGDVPEKPLVVAHRGASMLAPENTLAAAWRAADMEVYALETDVHVSKDGQLFLLHDETFDRTTDIRTVFPGREAELAENFTIDEVHKLNAGNWFFEQDPYEAVARGLITPTQEQEYRAQVIPLLADYLDIARQEKLAFIFDLKQPPAGHPYADSYFDLALSQIHQAGIDHQVWFIVDETQLPGVRQQAPAMLPTLGADYSSLPPAGELVQQGYRIVNVEYGINPGWIRQYQDAGLWVNVYTVDEPWQFARLWQLGVDSITTSNSRVMVNMLKPAWRLPYSMYVTLWIVVGLVGVGLIVGITYPALRPRQLTPSPLTTS